MLNAEETAGALVAGVLVNLEGKSYDEVRELVAKAEANGARLFVGGDTSDGSGEEEFMELGVMGFAIAIADVDGDPVEITRSKIEAALDRARGLPEIDGTEGERGTFLMCWGPLPAATLSVGVRCAAELDDVELYGKPADLKFRFFSMQNMSQEWGAEGVDGTRIASVEFSDVLEVDVSEEALAPKFAEISPQLVAPSIFLTARYD